MSTGGPELPPIHFVSRDAERWRAAASEMTSRHDLVHCGIALHGAVNWVFQAYLVFRDRDFDVRLSSELPRGGIAVIHSDELAVRRYRLDSFVVAIRADRAFTDLCDLQIVQNVRCVESKKDSFLEHWSQPGLVPRDFSRGDEIRRVGFIGQRRNLAQAFRDGAFEEKLARLGIEFVIRDSEMWDYRELDLILAVRDGRPAFLDAKPPSKLTNAWLGECPAVLGRESAFENLRRSELDFARGDSLETALESIARLQEDPALYRAMIENGRTRAEAYSDERQAMRWEEFFRGPMHEGYQRWCRDSFTRRVLRFGGRAFRARVVGRRYER